MYLRKEDEDWLRANAAGISKTIHALVEEKRNGVNSTQNVVQALEDLDEDSLLRKALTEFHALDKKTRDEIKVSAGLTNIFNIKLPDAKRIHARMKERGLLEKKEEVKPTLTREQSEAEIAEQLRANSISLDKKKAQEECS